MFAKMSIEYCTILYTTNETAWTFGMSQVGYFMQEGLLEIVEKGVCNLKIMAAKIHIQKYDSCTPLNTAKHIFMYLNGDS